MYVLFLQPQNKWMLFINQQAMPMDRNKMLRYQVLDRCFRDTSRLYNVSALLECCNNEMRRYDFKEISRRTIQKDIDDLRGEPHNVEFDEVLEKQYYYRYADTTQSLKVLKLINPNYDILSHTIDSLRKKYNNPDEQNPQWQWMLLTLQSLVDNRTVEIDNPYVSFENNQAFSGNTFFSELLCYIINCQPIIICYRPYNKAKPSDVKIYPYLLKQYNSRWFLIARVDDVDEIITFALDRIIYIRLWKHTFKPSNVDFNSYYEDVTGVTVLSDEPISKIVLKVNAQRYPYIQTKPFSEKQKIESHDDESYVISFPMRINKEFTANILSYGSDIEVLKPLRLRKEIADILKKASLKYEETNKE